MVQNVSGDPVNVRTMNMLNEAEARCGFQLTIVQGKNPGGVTASAGTHDGWGVVDIRLRDFSDAQRAKVVLQARTVGFAAWERTPLQGFDSYHCHAVAVGDPGVSPAAARQIVDYKRGLNGLASHGRDDGPPGFYGQTWESYLQSRGGITVTAEESILNAITLLNKKLDAVTVEVETLSTGEAGRYKRYEAIHKETTATINAARDAVLNAVKATA